MKIIGAGLAGLIAANVFPQATIIEAAGRNKVEHKAVLRFRSTAVADATGIEFRKVRVNKGIFSYVASRQGRFVAPSIQLANMYSKKAIGNFSDRSIWNLEPSDRYIAPEDFIPQLIQNCDNRISWGEAFDFSKSQEAVISTAPMSVAVKALGVENSPTFSYRNIFVKRFRIQNADVFQTVYFPDPETGVYRASITKDLLIIEAVREINDADVEMVNQAFWVGETSEIESSKHSFGKIALIDDAWRKNFILKLSTERKIFSVGRFATWRNILLDDVVHDLSVVKKLIKLGNYQLTKEAAS